MTARAVVCFALVAMLSGCVTATPTPPDASAEVHDEPTYMEATARVQGSRPGFYGGSSSTLELPPNATRILLTASWTPDNPLAQEIEIHISRADFISGGETIVTKEGKSPLQIILDEATLQKLGGKLTPQLFPAQNSYFINQTVELSLEIETTPREDAPPSATSMQGAENQN